MAEICHELSLAESYAAGGADLVTGFHHVVWMGDLNYRLEYGQQVGACAVLIVGCRPPGCFGVFANVCQGTALCLKSIYSAFHCAAASKPSP